MPGSNPGANPAMSYAQGHWQLAAGLILVCLIALLAVLGPALAPRDPMQENYITFIDKQAFIRPPFPALTTPGFPLGSDEFGRDVFSRVLWAIRPTMILVMVVASLRLLLGTLFGLIAGWNPRRFRWLNSIISFAVSFPVFFIALFFIAATGFKLGLWAFVIGMLLTGWGDSARLVREQTRTLKTQPYIEASRALGASGGQNLFNHILPQTISLVWMMLAFEVSNTILISAELGVLGYFINSVWIPVEDWVGMRASGLPELGQMLSGMQVQPWGALAAGLVIFLAVLGFNLVGEGLRIAASPEGKASRRRSAFTQWIDYRMEQLFDPLSPVRRQGPAVLAICALVGIIGVGAYSLVKSQNMPLPAKTLQIPGDQIWVGTNRDAQGTHWIPYPLLQSPRIAWSYAEFINQASFSGSPAVGKDGTIYAASLNQTLSAISPSGKVLWQAKLPNQPVDSPAIGPSGTIYLTDDQGGLMRVLPGGKASQLFVGAPNTRALAGPVISRDETIFFVNDSDLLAVASTGDLLWKASLPSYSITNPYLKLTPDYQFIIFEDMAFLASNGQVISDRTRNPLDMLIIGTDGNTYSTDQNSIRQMQITAEQIAIIRTVKWDARTIGTGFRFSNDIGLAPDEKIWIFYGKNWQSTQLLWLDPSGILLGTLDYPYLGDSSRLIALDNSDTALVCGFDEVSQASECRANRGTNSAPVWKMGFDAPIAGGAAAANELYLTTTNGVLYALEDSNP